MQSEMKKLGADGLVFFGQISASISHELKNVLATVYETAGLMDDLVDISQENGEELDPEHTRKLCSRILEQIRRGNSIIKNMNSFAHSVDEPLHSVDAVKMAEFMISLCSRFASIKEVRLQGGNMDFADVSTDPFFLELILYRCILFALKNPDEDRNIILSVHSLQDGAEFRLQGTAPITDGFPEPAMAELRNALQAKLDILEDKKGIRISLPRNLERPPRGLD